MANADYYFEYDATHRVFASRVTGPFTDAIFETWYGETAKLVTQIGPDVALLDLTDCPQFDLSPAIIRKVAQLHPILADPALRVVIAPSDVSFGTARMFQLASPAGREMLEIVRSVDEGYRVLGITDPAFIRLPDTA